MGKAVRLEALTGIRFFAAFCVVMFHANNVLGETAVANHFILMHGVSLFFILSGFILLYNYPVLDSKEDKLRFWLNRVVRLWPLHLVTTFLLLWWVTPFIHRYWAPEYQKLTVLLNLLLLHAWVPLGDFSLSLNGVSWSTSVEWFLYLVFPLLLWIWKRDFRLLVVGVAVVVVSLIALGNYAKLPDYDPQHVSLFGILYFNPLSRLLEFVAGMAGCLIYQRLLPKAEKCSAAWITGGELAAFAAVIGSMGTWPYILKLEALRGIVGDGGIRWIVTAGTFPFLTMLVVVLALQKGLLARLLSTPVIVKLGEISFPLFLIHCHFLYIYMDYNMYTRFFDLGIRWTYGVYWIIIIAASYPFLSGVEEPARRWLLHKLRGRIFREDGGRFRLTKGELGGMILLLCLAIGTKWGIGLQEDYLARLDREEAQQLIAASTWRAESGVPFGVEFRLLAVDAQPVDDNNFSVQLIWQAERNFSLRYQVVVQFLDGEGRLISQKAYHQQPMQIHVAEQTLWRDRILAEKRVMADVRSVAVVCKERPGAVPVMLDVKADQTDWNGKRLLLEKSVLKNIR